MSLFILGVVLGVLCVLLGLATLLAPFIVGLEVGPTAAISVFVIGTLLTVGAGVGAAFAHAAVVTGEGTETGYVTSIQTHGAIWPTPDVFFKTDLDNSETYQYCIDKDDAHDVLDTLRDAQTNRHLVRITYEDRAWWHPWVCNNGPMIIDVEVLE